MRYFELRTDKDTRFWNIEINGKYVVKQYGKTGGKVQEVKDEYIDEDFAKKDTLKLIAKKLKEGYIELPGGDSDHEKWHNEKAVVKAPKKENNTKPAKSKEKRIPIELIVEKTGFEIQQKSDSKARFKNPKIIASYICKNNEIASPGEVNIGVKNLGDGYLLAVSKSWNEVTDLFNLKEGTCCRITSSDPERRTSGLLIDKNYFYAMAIKGFEAESRNLVKYDLDTNEIVWTCGSSSSSITPRFIQDEEYIYASDVKTLYVTSKSLGKNISKIDIATKMDKKQKFYSNTSKRFLHVYKTGDAHQILCGSLVNIVLVNLREESKLWEISSKIYQKIMASYVHNEKLYVLGEKSILFVIDIASGNIEHELKIKHDFEMEKCGDFYLEDNELTTIFRNGEQKILLRINIDNLSYKTNDYTTFFPKSHLFDPQDVIKDGLIIATNRKQLTVIEKDTGKKVSSLEIPGNGNIIRFVVVGDYIYLAQKTEEENDNSSILHQIK